jgi:hypothetical protein
VIELDSFDVRLAFEQYAGHIQIINPNEWQILIKQFAFYHLERVYVCDVSKAFAVKWINVFGILLLVYGPFGDFVSNRLGLFDAITICEWFERGRYIVTKKQMLN